MMNGIRQKYAAILIVVTLLASILILLSQSDDSPIDVIPSQIAKDFKQDKDSIDKSRSDSSSDQSSGSNSSSSEDVSNQVREVIESTSTKQLSESNWRITDEFDHPRTGIHVVCTLISPELIQTWLTLEDDGVVPDPELFETCTDSKGCFDFPSLEQGCYLVRADAPGFSPALGILDLSNKRPEEFTAVMLKEKIIRGKVLDCNQRPVKETSICCYMTPACSVEEMPLHCAGEYILFKQHLLTDEKGLFEFKGLYRDPTYTLHAEHSDFLPLDKTVASHDKNEVVLILKKPCVLEGRVVSTSGEPLVDAKVDYCEPQSPFYYKNINIIGPEGQFRSDAMPEGLINLQGKHEKYGHDTIKMNLRPDKVNYAELKLPKGIKVHIVVTDEQDKPLENARVSVRAQDSGAYICSDLTDESGEITVCSLNPGLRNSVYIRDLRDEYSIHDKTYIFNKDCDLRVRLRKRIPIQMVVMDESTKEVISNYKVCVCSFYKNSALRETNSFNVCAFECDMNTPKHTLFIGEEEFFEITVIAAGYMPERVMAKLLSENDDQNRSIEIYLKPGSTLNGCVLDADTFSPISDATLQLYVDGIYDKRPGFPLSIDRTSTTSKDGTFSLPGMPDHRFFLKGEAPGYAPTVVNSRELNLSAPSIENRIYLKRGGGLCGRIYGEDKYPIDQAYVQMRISGTNEVLTSRTNTNGFYSFCDLPPGEHIVSVWDVMDNATSLNTMKLQKMVEIEQGQTTTADFTFEGSGIIRGLCTVDGEEGCGIVINLFDDKGVKTHSVDASSTGFYKISSILPGSYTLEAHSTVIGAGGMIKRPVTLQNGQDLTLDLDFKGKAVYGTVSDAEGQPIHAAEVELLTPSFQRDYLTYTDYEGSYAIFNVEEGNYLVVARAPSCGEERKGPWMLGGTQKSGKKVDFALKPGGAVRMHINDSQGNPIPNAKVFLSNNMSQGVLWTKKTKYSGIAVFDSLQTESLSVLAIAKGYTAGGTTLLAPAGEIADTEITLVQGGSFKLTVRSKNGIPVPDAQVTLMDFTLLGLPPIRLTQLCLLTPSNPGFLTDEKGVFSLGLLPSGNYKVQVTKGNRVAQVPVSITSGQETGVQAVLE